jgi:transcription elongation factor Elf1
MPVKCKRCDSKKVALKETETSFLYKCKNCRKEWEVKKETL